MDTTADLTTIQRLPSFVIDDMLQLSQRTRTDTDFQSHCSNVDIWNHWKCRNITSQLIISRFAIPCTNTFWNIALLHNKLQPVKHTHTHIYVYTHTLHTTSHYVIILLISPDCQATEVVPSNSHYVLPGIFEWSINTVSFFLRKESVIMKSDTSLPDLTHPTTNHLPPHPPSFQPTIPQTMVHLTNLRPPPLTLGIHNSLFLRCDVCDVMISNLSSYGIQST